MKCCVNGCDKDASRLVKWSIWPKGMPRDQRSWENCASGPTNIELCRAHSRARVLHEVPRSTQLVDQIVECCERVGLTNPDVNSLSLYTEPIIGVG